MLQIPRRKCHHKWEVVAPQHLQSKIPALKSTAVVTSMTIHTITRTLYLCDRHVSLLIRCWSVDRVLTLALFRCYNAGTWRKRWRTSFHSFTASAIVTTHPRRSWRCTTSFNSYPHHPHQCDVISICSFWSTENFIRWVLPFCSRIANIRYSKSPIVRCFRLWVTIVCDR